MIHKPMVILKLIFIILITLTMIPILSKGGTINQNQILNIILLYYCCHIAVDNNYSKGTNLTEYICLVRRFEDIDLNCSTNLKECLNYVKSKH